jgi:two-component sensor histidine kinase
LPIDTAIPLGLVATELLANACKHAFPDKVAGSITLSFDRSADGGARLTIADDGIGAPANIYRSDHSAGVGSMVVPLLARQIGATVTLSKTSGTVVTIEMPPGAVRIPA